MENTIKLTDFILEKYTEAKVPEQTLEITFGTETKVIIALRQGHTTDYMKYGK